MTNITSLFLKNYYYRLTQMLYNLMNIILTPFVCIYFFIGIYNIVNKIQGNTIIDYIFFILLAFYSFIVIMYSIGYLLFNPMDTIIRSGFIYNIGFNVYVFRCKMYKSFLFKLLSLLWNWFLSPFALSVVCKTLGIFQDNGYAVIYYIIYLAAWFTTAFAYTCDECYNNFI